MSERGPSARWTELSAHRRWGLSLGTVAAALEGAGQAGEPPAPDSWALEPSRGRGSVRPRGVPAAVLVALFELSGEARVLLTRRSVDVRAHRGQVSFPGGRIEAGEGVWEAARREAFEEVGLDPAAVSPLGWLRAAFTVSSNTLIFPVVGALERRPQLVANPGEVARVFDVALADLARDDVFREERWPAQRADQTYPVYFFKLDGETVWGATARLLVDLLNLVGIVR